MTEKTYHDYDKNVLLRPPPWFVGENIVPPSIPISYSPMRIVEKDNPREPLGPLLAIDDPEEILINYYYQRGNHDLDSIRQQIARLPRKAEDARAYLYKIVQDYLAALTAPLDDLCHSQQPFLDCDAEKSELCRVMDYLRWRQARNALRAECAHRITYKRQMIAMLREIRERAARGEAELIVRNFPSKYCPGHKE